MSNPLRRSKIEKMHFFTGVLELLYLFISKKIHIHQLNELLELVAK